MGHRRAHYRKRRGARTYAKGAASGFATGRLGRRSRIRPRQRGFLREAGYYKAASGSSGELKFFDRTVDSNGLSAAGIIIPTSGSLNIVVQGTDEVERIGRKIVIRSIMWRWLITVPQTLNPSDTTSTVRLMLVLDKQCNGTIINPTDVTETANFQSFNNLVNKGRFRILMDRMITVNSTSGTDTATGFGRASKPGSFYMKCAIPIEYSQPTGAMTSIRSNNLTCLAFDGEGHAILDSIVRCRFTDG